VITAVPAPEPDTVAVLPGAVPALRAGAAGVLWFHPLYPDSGQTRLIGDELLEPVEGPGVQGPATVPAVPGFIPGMNSGACAAALCKGRDVVSTTRQGFYAASR